MRRRQTSRRGPRSYGGVGLAVALVLAGAVYLASTADSGLPWQSYYGINAEVPNAHRLNAKDEVRIAGIRVGAVSDVTAVPARGGRRPYARVSLDLDRSAGPLPADTRVQVRSASALGATYVELTPGRSTSMLSEGGTLPLRSALSSVQLVDLLGIFDRATARSIHGVLGELGPGLAGRGRAVNATLQAANDLLPPLSRTAEVLAAPETRLSPFISAYESTAEALSPVSEQLGQGVEGGATTLGALAKERAAVGASIAALPSTESAVTDGLSALRRPLNGLSTLVTQLRPAARMLPGTVGEVNSTLSAASRPLRRLPRFARRLGKTLRTLRTVTRLRATDGAVRKLIDVVDAADTTLRVLTPAQVHCNVIGLFAVGFGTGTVMAGGGLQAITFFGLSSLGAEGSMMQSAAPARDLHVNYLPIENASECEAGNEPFTPGKQSFGNPPGDQPKTVPDSAPPPGALERAERAGLIQTPRGTP